MLEQGDVLKRVAVYGNDVRPLAGLEGSDLVRPAQQIGVVDGRGLNRLQGAHANADVDRQLMCVQAVRVNGGVGTQAEMGRMVVEKASAVAEAQFAATTAAAAGNKDHVIAEKALKVFRKRVRANRRRLSRR